MYVLDNFSTGKIKNLAGVLESKNLKLARTDVRRIPSSLLRGLRKIDRVLHLAAVTDVEESIKNPIVISDVNLMAETEPLSFSFQHDAECAIHCR
jgi:UDP-glucose 4-epimerase